MQSSFTRKSPGPLNKSSASGQDNGISPLNLAIVSGPGALTQTNQFLGQLAQWKAQLANSKTLQSHTLPHITMVVVVLLIVGLSQLNLPWGAINAVRPLKYEAEEIPAANEQTTAAELTLPTELNNTQDDVLVRAAVPHTIIPDRSQPEQFTTGSSGELRSYAVESGDNITLIAAKFGLNPETIVWSNPDLEEQPDVLSIGQALTILPVDGVYHQVGGSDTINAIASTFKTNPELIINHPANGLDPENPIIQPGQWLVVPGGSKPVKARTVRAFTYDGPVPENAIVGSGSFGWPASGSISQGFYGYHPAIDIAGWTGAPVLAADAGYVIAAGWDGTGYGTSIVVDHGNGYQTLYAHLNDYYVQPGTNVTKGQTIGEMGCTGNCTGPHLHFEVRNGTIQHNPYGYLP